MNLIMGTLYRGVSLEVFAKHPTGWNVPHVASEFLHDWILALLVDPSLSGKGVYREYWGSERAL